MKIDRVVTGYLEENCYILTINDVCLVIDPGDDFPFIEEKLVNDKVLAILLTHNHFDHIGAVNDIVGKYKVPVYSFSNLEEGLFNIEKFKFKVIYTPGHTKDSISFYFEEEKAMFTGDFLFKKNIGRCDLPTGDFKKMQKSIQKIKCFPDDITIYPGHGESTTLGYEKNNNQYLFTN